MKKSLLFILLSCLTLASKAQTLSLLGHLSYGSVTCAGVWHYVDSLNNEYAIVGARDRVSIVDVSNPATPVEVFSVPALSGQTSLWREVKTHGKFAYAVSEGGGGVIVIDLTNLPASINSHHWYGDSTITGQIGSAHTVAATDGYLYIFGSNVGSGGCIIADLNDPWNPHFTGLYDLEYIHDGYIRNDTLWAGEIYAGQFSVIDVSDKSAPALLATQTTPGQFCHNVWLSDNSDYAYTTDEQPNAPLGSFDVTNINNIQLKAVYFTDSLPNEEVHNVRVLNDFLINPSYGSQLTIVDGARPENLIEIGRAPTDFGSGQPYLCWDASPYLPSGKIIVTDIDGGLLIYGVDYVRACYLEGTAVDSLSGNSINGVTVEILATPKTTLTNLSGEYKTGLATAGIYDVRFSKQGYITKTYTGISLANGVLTNLTAELLPFMVSGQVTAIGSGIGIPNVQVVASNGTSTVSATTDANGDFQLLNVISGGYLVTAAGWGYMTQCINQVLDGTSPVALQLSAGYMDDFTTNNGWTVTSTCTTGAWVRVDPVLTTYGLVNANPGNDVSDDCGNLCYVTGNGGGTATFDDVDEGGTLLTSPIFDLSTYVDPYISYERWFFMNANAAPGSHDTLYVTVDNGFIVVTLDAVSLSNVVNGTWMQASFRVSNYIAITPTMTISVYSSDKVGTSNLVEGGFDNFIVTEGPLAVDENNIASEIKVYPNPFQGTISISVDASVLTEQSLITVTDVSGRIVYTGKFNRMQNNIDLPEQLAKGVYILKLEKTARLVNPAIIVKD